MPGRPAPGGKRTKALRVTALDAHRAARAARESGREAAFEAARAFELDAGDDPAVGAGYVEKTAGLAGPVVVEVLKRYPDAPAGGRRAGELLRMLDVLLRR